MCIDRISGLELIVQTKTFLSFNAKAVTLGQGQGKAIQYIFLDLYFDFPKYVRFRSNGFDVRSEGCCGGGGRANELKT